MPDHSKSVYTHINENKLTYSTRIVGFLPLTKDKVIVMPGQPLWYPDGHIIRNLMCWNFRQRYMDNMTVISQVVTQMHDIGLWTNVIPEYIGHFNGDGCIIHVPISLCFSSEVNAEAERALSLDLKPKFHRNSDPEMPPIKPIETISELKTISELVDEVAEALLKNDPPQKEKPTDDQLLIEDVPDAFNVDKAMYPYVKDWPLEAWPLSDHALSVIKNAKNEQEKERSKHYVLDDLSRSGGTYRAMMTFEGSGCRYLIQNSLNLRFYKGNTFAVVLHYLNPVKIICQYESSGPTLFMALHKIMLFIKNEFSQAKNKSPTKTESATVLELDMS